MKTGYANGSDFLLSIKVGTASKCVGRCSSTDITYSSDTKDRAVKALATKPIGAGLWKAKGVTGLSISIKAQGFIHYDEEELSFAELVKAWKAGQPVEVSGFERRDTGATKDPAPYLVGMFIISSLEFSSSAEDDATYNITLDNCGEPSVWAPETIGSSTAAK